MNARQAQYIQTIAQEGSITAAAKKLYVSQPSLSQMVRQIENEAGVALFDRSTLPMRLTYAGEKYLECARAMLLANSRLENQLQDIRKANSGRLRLGISVQRSMQMLPLAMPWFSMQYPNVTIELREAGSGRLEDLLRTGEIDLALAAMESTSARFDYRLIESETIGVLAARTTALAARYPDGTPICLENAAGERFVSLKQGHSVRVVQEQLFRRYAMEPKILLETDSLEVAKRVTVACGACMLCSDIYMDDLTKKLGTFYPLLDYENHRHFYACWRKGDALPRYAEDFVRCITQALTRKDPPGETPEPLEEG